MKLKQLIAAFLAHQRLLVQAGTSSPKTLRWYEDLLKPLKPLHKLPAKLLRTCHLVDIKITNGFARALKRMTAWAAEEELIPKDYFRKFKGPPCGRRERVLTRTEVCRLLLTCSRPLRRLLFVLFYTIARPGEIRDLTWGQIDWRKRCIILTKFKAQDRRRDKAKERPIPLPVHVVRLLRNMHRKSPDRSYNGRVFYSTRGYIWSPNGLRSAIMRARERVGLDRGPEKVVCYHLRHTQATNAVRQGLDLKHLAEIMGHTTTKTTERYTHLDTNDVVRAIDFVAARPRKRSQKPVAANLAG